MVCALGLFFLAWTFFCWISPSKDFSLTERRKLAQMPKISGQSLLSGRFMKDFESYTQDQFPLRETMRSIAAGVSTKLLGKSDSHDIYLVNGTAAKLEYPLNEKSIAYAASRFRAVYEKYLKDANTTIYASIIPDKNYFLAPQKGCPSMDYARQAELLQEGMPYAAYIDITDTLDETCYYATDPHWRQEKIGDAAHKLADGLGVRLSAAYETKTATESYKGTYAGQSALSMKAEAVNYMTNEMLENCEVFNHEANKPSAVYDLSKADGRDPYELFLSGPVSLITIKNPAARENRRLILIRDSFGSSIAPYFIEAYQELVLVDIRYISLEYLSKFVDFQDADVLFLYSSSVLNHSETIK